MILADKSVAGLPTAEDLRLADLDPEVASTLMSAVHNELIEALYSYRMAEVVGMPFSRIELLSALYPRIFELCRRYRRQGLTEERTLAAVVRFWLVNTPAGAGEEFPLPTYAELLVLHQAKAVTSGRLAICRACLAYFIYVFVCLMGRTLGAPLCRLALICRRVARAMQRCRQGQFRAAEPGSSDHP